MGVLKNVPQNVTPIVEGERVRVLTIVAPIILLSLILPTWDVTSDWLLILEFFTGEFDTCLSRNWTHPCPQDNCAIWKGCTYRGPNNTESCGYCKEHPSVCDSQINFGFMLLGKLFWMLDIMYKDYFAVPFLLSYFKSFYTWWSEASNKKLTFIFPLLNWYPQYGKLNLW